MNELKQKIKACNRTHGEGPVTVVYHRGWTVKPHMDFVRLKCLWFVQDGDQYKVIGVYRKPANPHMTDDETDIFHKELFGGSSPLRVWCRAVKTAFSRGVEVINLVNP